MKDVDVANKKLILEAGITRKEGYNVNDLVYHPGRDEVDLMKIIIRKPNPDNGGEVELTLRSGSAKVWTNSWKGSEVVLPKKIATKDIPKDGQVYWIEAAATSQKVRDVELRLTYQGKYDTVKATAIWVSLNSRPGKDGKNMNPWYNRQQQDGPPNNPVPGRDLPDIDKKDLKDLIEIWRAKDGSRYGFGTIKKDILSKEDTFYGGRILHEFKIAPAGVDKLAVLFDCTRQVGGRILVMKEGYGLKKDGFGEFQSNANDERVFPWLALRPWDNEQPNDDTNASDEDNEPSNGMIYSFDGPSNITYQGATCPAFLVRRSSFQEWVRIRVGVQQGEKFEEGSGVQGSRASDRFDWHVIYYQRKDQGNKLVRDDAPAAASFPTLAHPPMVTSNGTAKATALDKTVTEGLTATYDKTTLAWSLKGTSDPNNPAVAQKKDAPAGTQWTLTLPNRVTLVITQGTIPFETGDQFLFSAFKTSAAGGKQNRIGLGSITITDAP